uniref:Uncharacterized protein n=1 Tax=Dendroctonus ponderosae TaxID=77166 RepID=A0AAR5PEG0_DENPD
MTYGIEIREATNKTKYMLRVAEMKTLRTIVGKIRRDTMRNTDIWEQCGVQDVVRWERQRKRQRYSHVKRPKETSMDENCLPHIVLKRKPVGTRPVGRLPKRWKDSWHSTSHEILQKRAQN